MDNFNTHTPSALYETFEPKEAKRLWDRFEFVYTPKSYKSHPFFYKPHRYESIQAGTTVWAGLLNSWAFCLVGYAKFIELITNLF